MILSVLGLVVDLAFRNRWLRPARLPLTPIVFGVGTIGFVLSLVWLVCEVPGPPAGLGTRWIDAELFSAQTITTVGYGSPTFSAPQTRVAAILGCIAGSLWWALLIAPVADRLLSSRLDARLSAVRMALARLESQPTPESLAEESERGAADTSPRAQGSEGTA